jgi:pimeloyl-ACP methyl ester carboxylesterase
MQQVTSKDGTTIAYDKTGTGQPLIIVASALADRSGTTKLATLLSESFTVINYDRRGRGASSDTQPFAVQREVEDIEALIDAVGGKAFLFGSSSGAALALEAASKLGNKVQKLFLYEPPFIIDNSRPPLPDDFAEQVRQLVAAGRRNEAVKLFFTDAIGIPKIFVLLMRFLMPGWSKAVAMAHTIPYDITVLAGTQCSRPLPAHRWNNTVTPTLVMVGSKSEAFFHSGAQALAHIMPNAAYQPLEGKDHGAVMMSPKAIADAMVTYFKS